MSKIASEILGVTKIAAKGPAENDADFSGRLVRALDKLTDAQWNSLSEPTKKWHTAACVAINGKQPIPPLPDLAAKPVGAVRPRVAAPAKPAAPAPVEEPVDEEPAGDEEAAPEEEESTPTNPDEPTEASEDVDPELEPEEEVAEPTPAPAPVKAPSPAKPAVKAPSAPLKATPIRTPTAPVKVAPPTATKPAAAAPPAQPAIHPDTLQKKGSVRELRRLIITNPAITRDELTAALNSAGFTAAPSSVDATMSDTLAVLAMVKELGHWVD